MKEFETDFTNFCNMGEKYGEFLGKEVVNQELWKKRQNYFETLDRIARMRAMMLY